METGQQNPYIAAIAQHCSKYPDLKYLHKFLQKKVTQEGRASLLEFCKENDGRWKVVQKGFSDAGELANNLRSPEIDRCNHRLYLLEDLSESYVGTFGSHFWMDPFLFASQERSNWISGKEPSLGMTYRLPSAEKEDSIFTLRYYEMIINDSTDLPDGMRTISNIDRIIDKEKFAEDGVLSIKRNASLWSRKVDNDGWDALLLLEPPVGDEVIVGGNTEPHKLKTKPYNGGFVDFSPWVSTRSDSTGLKEPTRKSIFDDVGFYWTKVAKQEDIIAATMQATEATRYLTKIIASNWNVLLEYIWKTLNRMDTKLGSFERPKGIDEEEVLQNLAETLANANLWRRRLSWYSDSLELNLQNLGIPTDLGISRVPRPASTSTMHLDDKEDFLAIFQRWRNAVKRLDSLIQVVIGTLSVLEGRLSIAESKRVAVLTWLGVLFIPLSFSASFFAMADEYKPGREKLWIYFAVALPMVFLVAAVAIFARKLLRYRESRVKRARPSDKRESSASSPKKVRVPHQAESGPEKTTPVEALPITPERQRVEEIV